MLASDGPVRNAPLDHPHRTRASSYRPGFFAEPQANSHKQHFTGELHGNGHGQMPANRARDRDRY
jgi:hypothetical protein